MFSVTSFVKQQNTPSCKLHYHNNGSRRHYTNLSKRLSAHASISTTVTAKTSAIKYSYLSCFDEFVDVFYSVYTGFLTVLGWMDASPEKVMTNHKQRLTSMRLDLGSALLLTTLKGKGLFFVLRGDRGYQTSSFITFWLTWCAACAKCLDYILQSPCHAIEFQKNSI